MKNIITLVSISIIIGLIGAFLLIFTSKSEFEKSNERAKQHEIINTEPQKTIEDIINNEIPSQ
jgi:nitrogen fixation-related uncharacterized protein